MSPHQVEWLALTRCPFANAVLGSLGVACKVAEVAPPPFFSGDTPPLLASAGACTVAVQLQGQMQVWELSMVQEHVG